MRKISFLSVEDVDEEELKEVFAAGWKAKQKTAEVRKSRGWKKPDQRGAKGGSQSTDARKKVTTCASCGKVGHWKGDAECPNVQSGQDPPHQKKVNEVHFTFMVGGPGGGGPPEIPAWSLPSLPMGVGSYSPVLPTVWCPSG